MGGPQYERLEETTQRAGRHQARDVVGSVPVSAVSRALLRHPSPANSAGQGHAGRGPAPVARAWGPSNGKPHASPTPHVATIVRPPPPMLGMPHVDRLQVYSTLAQAANAGGDSSLQGRG